MGTVRALYDFTVRFHEHLQANLPQEDREEYIDKIEQFLEERQQLIDALPSEYSSKERAVGEKIVEYNREIDHRLDRIFRSIKQEVGNIKRQKVNNRRYANPYQGVSADGMFLDQRK